MLKCYKCDKSQLKFDKIFFSFSYEQLYSFDTQDISDSLIEIDFFFQKCALPFETMYFS